MIGSKRKRIRGQIRAACARICSRTDDFLCRHVQKPLIIPCIFWNLHVGPFIYVQGWVTDPLGGSCHFGDTVPVHLDILKHLLSSSPMWALQGIRLERKKDGQQED